MSELEGSFAKLLGRQPSDTERQKLYQVRDALGLKNNDALWLVLMALEHYQGQYEKFPEKIAQATKDALLNFKATADATVKASAEAAKADMAKVVAETAQKVARSTVHTKRAQWIAACALIIALTFGGATWYAHDYGTKAGYSLGYGMGYQEAKDEKAAAAWANTPEGEMAYLFAQSGELQRLAQCSRDGWKIQNGICYPFSHTENGKDMVRGWRIPRIPDAPKPGRR
jgi:hypothetical protein